MNKALLFSKRKQLAKIFEKWAEENKVSNNSYNVITYLALHNLLDIKKLKVFLSGEDNE